MTEQLIWAFDLGKGSLGEVVRCGSKFLHKDSLLIPEDFAETKTAANRRRMWRTREAHHAREEWLDKVMLRSGIESMKRRKCQKVDGVWLQPQKGDERLEREFPKKGDKTCYTSCLLRIKLLRGEKLEPWQIYKALHSSIQKRGYGKVPWAAKEAARKNTTPEELEKKEQAELEKKDPAYKEAVEAWEKFKLEIKDASFHFPCYYDAAKMGLWNPAQPDILQERITHNAQSTRRVRFDREDIEKEIMKLAQQAAKQLPQIQRAFEEIKAKEWMQCDAKTDCDKHFTVRAKDFAEFLVYGPAGKPHEEKDFHRYLYFRKEQGIRSGSTDDWMGVLAQKTPRFDNRIINTCALIPRFHVCKTMLRRDKDGQLVPDSLLAAEATCLMKLKNFRIERLGQQIQLTAEEIQKIFEDLSNKAQEKAQEVFSKTPHDLKWQEKVARCYEITKDKWKKKCKKELHANPLAGHCEIEAPRASERSRFSRPALRILKNLILSGKQPLEIYEEEKAALKGNDPRKGLVENDLKFLRDMPNDWGKIHIPEQRMDALTQRLPDKNAAIRELIGSVNDPIVRHRLFVFAQRIAELEKYGKPDHVALEFVRKDFMGDKAKKELSQFQNRRKKERDEAAKQVSELGLEEKSARLKYELWKAQGYICLYTGDSLDPLKLSDYEIEHIVPRRRGGPDAMVNYVLTTRQTNEAKGDKTPYEWLSATNGWDAYKNRVEKAVQLGRKKVKLLSNAEAPELVEKYTALAETAWISKLAQKILCLHFGWRNSVDEEGRKRITVVSGGLTARIRRKYHLNQILAPSNATEEEAEKKNRDDDRHHALDAMVISFIPQWMRDSQKEHFFRFPVGVQENPRGFFEKNIADIMPKNICFEKPRLAETIYGYRKEEDLIVQRTELIDLAFKAEKGMKKYDLGHLAGKAKKIRDQYLQELVLQFAQQEPSEGEWLAFCKDLRLKRKDETSEEGTKVIRVTVNVGSPEEYKDLSKDGSGAWRNGKGSHKGQFVYRDANGEVSVRPVYVFQSIKKVREELKKEGFEKADFFQSDCAVRTTKEIPSNKYKLVVKNEANQKRRISVEKPLPPCELILRNIVTKSSDAELTLANNTRVVASLDAWLDAGLCRIK